MHQTRWQLGLRPKLHWGAYNALPNPLAGFKGPTSKVSTLNGSGREVMGGKKGKGREGAPNDLCPGVRNSLAATDLSDYCLFTDGTV